MPCQISPHVQEQTDSALQNMIVAKSCNKTMLTLEQKGEHNSLSLIQKDKTKVPLHCKMTVCSSVYKHNAISTWET